MTEHPRVAYVLAAARRGWHVFPLQAGGKRPTSGFTAWERHATTDAATIRAFWARGDCNYGIACGPSNLVAVDLDTPKDGATPPPEWALPGVVDGSDVLATLAERHNRPLPLDTLTVRTASGGMHLYFTAPPTTALRNTCARLGWLVDTRATGGYVVGPGSTVDGHTYAIIHNAAPAPLPDWLATLLTHPTAPPAALHGVLSTRHTSHPAGYATTALRSEVQRVLDAHHGTRNHTLNAAAFALGQLTATGLLTRQLAYDCLHTAAHHAGLPAREANATIYSGLEAGAAAPRGSAA